jgi:hypothetical protein
MQPAVESHMSMCGSVDFLVCVVLLTVLHVCLCVWSCRGAGLLAASGVTCGGVLWVCCSTCHAAGELLCCQSTCQLHCLEHPSVPSHLRTAVLVKGMSTGRTASTHPRLSACTIVHLCAHTHLDLCMRTVTVIKN